MPCRAPKWLGSNDRGDIDNDENYRHPIFEPDAKILEGLGQIIPMLLWSFRS